MRRDEDLERTDLREEAHLHVSLSTISKLTLFTLTTFPSTTSPLNGFMTMAVYWHLNRAWPVPGIILPSPMLLTVTTEMI